MYWFDFFFEEAQYHIVLVSIISTGLQIQKKFLLQVPYDLKTEALKHYKYSTYNRNHRVLTFLFVVNKLVREMSSFVNIVKNTLKVKCQKNDTLIDYYLS